MKNKQPEGKAENKWGQSKTLTPFILSIPWTSLYSESVIHVTAAYRPSVDIKKGNIRRVALILLVRLSLPNHSSITELRCSQPEDLSGPEIL